MAPIIRRILRTGQSLSPITRRWPWPWPRRPRPVDDAEVLRVQVGVIREALGDEVGTAGRDGISSPRDDADAIYLFRRRHALVREADLEAVTEFIARRDDVFDGQAETLRSPVPGLAVLVLPNRLDEQDPVLATLEQLDRELGPGIVTPDHVVYVTKKPTMCPATEPEMPGSRRVQPWPPPRRSRSRVADGDRVRVAVVDTGLWTDAVGSATTPWLAKGAVFADPSDVEQVDPHKIHPYAGHGTFVAGVIGCVAPDTRVEVEGVLVHGGAVFESEIVAQLHEAINDDDHPQIISISAGTHTRGDFASVAFELLWEHVRRIERDHILIVAAAGNDGSDQPFWPAAFPWAVGVGSVDPDGKVSDFSNVGEKWVDVYARGRDHVNAFPKGTYTCYEPPNAGQVRTFDGLAQWSGTSFSTPLVTGLIAARMRETGESAREAWQAVRGTATSATDPRGGQIRIVGPLT